MDRVSLRSIRATLALMVMRSIYQGKCRSVTWVERRETFGAALAWPARTMAKRSRGAPAPEFLFTNATICLPETEAERRKRHVARMSVSEIRGGHSSFQLVPGFHGACHRAGHFGPDPLVHPGYKFIRLQRREAERRQTRISNLRTPTFILAASGRTEEGARRASIGTRSPVGVPPRHLLRRTNANGSAPATRFLGRGPDRRYPSSACPSPASSSQTGHNAGRAYSRSRPRTELRAPPAGTAPAPSIGRHR